MFKRRLLFNYNMKQPPLLGMNSCEYLSIKEEALLYILTCLNYYVLLKFLEKYLYVANTNYQNVNGN